MTQHTEPAAAVLSCAMSSDCGDPVSHIDRKGYVYCAKHGSARKSSGIPCRQLRPAELQTLQRGEALRRY